MPYRKRIAITVRERAPWIAGLRDACLESIVFEAMIARDSALESLRHFELEGGDKKKARNCRREVEAADTILIKIRDGYYQNKSIEERYRVWKSAIDAVRKFAHAQECLYRKG